MRASCDAILMGAANVRYDNPRLLVRSKIRRDERTARGLPSPIEVTVAERVELDRCADYFTTSETETLVYSASPRVRDALSQLGALRP
jgi:5-amino-6-(5-phosphoribosylamino)uracil reductase